MSAFGENGVDETVAVDTLKGVEAEAFAGGTEPGRITGENYGPLKALCEQAAEAAMPGRVTNIRPGLIVGPGDPTDRFTCWPVRVARGGEVLGPGNRAAPVQFIDARDLGEFIVTCIEDGHEGVFNALGSGLTIPASREKPWQPELTFEEFLHTCKGVSGSDARFTWPDEAWLLSQQVGPWMELPLWIPGEGPGAAPGFARVSNARAAAMGLKIRPVADTIRDTLAWHNADAERTTPDYKWGAGMKQAREEKLLKDWAARENK
jgi:2'-hydroxyisoflavone reductase